MKKLSRSISILAGLFLTPWLAVCADQNIDEGGVYVVDQSTSLEQALSQALAENQASRPQRFWIVVSGPAVARVTQGGATAAQENLIKRARARGGLIYVCEPDLAASGIEPGDLLKGVRPVRGFEAAQEEDPLPVQPGEAILPHSDKQARLILRVCAQPGAPKPEGS